MIFFHAIEFLILRTLKNARNNAWTSQNHAESLGVLFSPDAMSKERQLYRLNVWCTVRVKKWSADEQKIFYRRFDVSSFWENQLKKEMTFISEIKNKISRTGMRNIYPVFHMLHKNPAKTQGMHFVSVKHWNIETHKLNRKINFWRITKSKTSPKGSIVSVVSKLWNALKMMKIAEHFSCFETNWNKPHFWCFEIFLKRTETWQKLTNVSVVLKRFETKLKQED